MPAQKKFIWGQNYPIKWNGDRHYWNLFFYGNAKGAVLKLGQYRFFFRNNSTFGVNDQAFSFIDGLHGLLQRCVSAFKFGAIYSDVQLSIHKSKQGHFGHFTLSDKYCVVRSKANRRNIDVGKVIRTKNILFFWIKFSAVFCVIGNKNESEH